MKSLIYVSIILSGNIIIPFFFTSSEYTIYDSIKAQFILTLLGVFVFEPILHKLRKSKKPKTIKYLFSKENRNDFIEDIFIYWLIFTVVFTYFSLRGANM